jgi:hypothetical protein
MGPISLREYLPFERVGQDEKCSRDLLLNLVTPSPLPLLFGARNYDTNRMPSDFLLMSDRVDRKKARHSRVYVLNTIKT